MSEPQKYFISVQALIEADKKILILHKNHISYDQKPCDIWTFPGGKVEEGENEIDALKRELKEEIGLQLEGVKVKFLNYYIIDKPFKDNNINLIVFIYKVDLEKLLDFKLTLEHDKYSWIDKNEFNNVELFSNKIKAEVLFENINI